MFSGWLVSYHGMLCGVWLCSESLTHGVGRYGTAAASGMLFFFFCLGPLAPMSLVVGVTK